MKGRALWGCFMQWWELGMLSHLGSSVLLCTGRPRAPQLCGVMGNNFQMTLLETVVPLPSAVGRTVKLELLKLPKSHCPVFATCSQKLCLSTLLALKTMVRILGNEAGKSHWCSGELQTIAGIFRDMCSLASDFHAAGVLTPSLPPML